MAERDYSALGLKCGLEIHQQLNTGKLFCNCPSVLRKDEPDFEIKRKLHAVAGEEGKVDVAAKHEAGLDREFTYQGYETTCLVELDEEPPHEINREALKIALQISLLLNCKILPISQIMRKTVIDGSNTSGFQRTMMIAQEGFVETQDGRVGIQSVCLEEDSARIVNREEGIFRLDRLGIPLVEIATDPDIKNPEQAKEAALHLGELLRSCNVKRGLGTIRQDVNISINKGKRVELKGFQDIRNIGKAIEVEVERQIILVKKNKSIKEVRRVTKEGGSDFLRPMPGAARMYPETDLPLLRISRKVIDDVKKTLPKSKKDVESELESQGLNKEFISIILKRGKIEEFKELLTETKKGNLIAKVLLTFPQEISKKEKIPLDKVEEILNTDVLLEIIKNVENGKISENDVKQVLLDVVKGKSVKEVISLEKESLHVVEEKVIKIIKSKPGLSPNAYMGLVMKDPKLKGKVSGKDVMEIINKYSNQ